MSFYVQKNVLESAICKTIAILLQTTRVLLNHDLNT